MASSAERVLTTRELNRATLARQLLLERAAITPLAAIERLFALQAQVARPPFVGLWTRVHGFTRAQLHRLLHDRAIVRATLLRGTLHLISAADFIASRAALQPMLDAGMAAILKQRAAAIDLGELAAFARTRLPSTFDALRPTLLERFPSSDERALGFAVRMQLPLVQVPTTDDRWSFPGNPVFESAQAWLGRPFASNTALAPLVRRYLAAFGPATVKDAERWSGLARLAPVFDQLRGELVTFRDDKRRQLFDLPDAPRPPADTAAPVRLVPDFDNLVLGHDDRRRVISDEHRPSLTTRNLQVKATFLVDGFVAGTWTVERTKAEATVVLAPFARLARAARAALEEEADALLSFVEPDAARRATRVAP